MKNKIKNKNKKAPVICIAVILALLLVVSCGIILHNRTEKINNKNNTVEIVSDGKKIYSFDLNKEKNRIFKIKYKNSGSNTVEIKNGKIRISEADCPDKVCVKHSWLESKDLPIVCLPHKLIIRFTEDN